VKVYITGASGTGKTSIARELAARGIPTLDMDTMCHRAHRETGEKVGWEPGKPEEWYAAHGWVCNVGGLEEFLSLHDTAVAVGLSSDQDEYLKLFDKVFVLYSHPEVIIERLNARKDNEYGKHPREQERLLKWHRAFEQEMETKGAIPINTERPLSETVEDILSRF